MKRYVIMCIVLLLAGTISLFGETNSINAEKKLVKVEKIYKGHVSNYPRPVSLYTIEVYMYPDLGEVEVTLYNIGAAEIGLYDSNGQEICYDCVDTDIPVTVNLSAMASHGTFYIVINSEMYYAEGAITF